MSKKPKPAKKPTATIPAWTCPKCGATHPITVPTCCGPTPLKPPSLPSPPTQPTRRNPFRTPFQPGIIPMTPSPPRPLDPFDFPRNVPQWWTFPPDITCNGSNP